MIKRHKIVIGIILLSKRKPTKLELMKWLFLLRSESVIGRDNTFYDFIPYDYGPFSFQLYRDLYDLSKLGYLTQDGNQIYEKYIGKARRIYNSLPKHYRYEVNRILDIYSNYSKNDLINYVYDKYSWFATNSKLLREKNKRLKTGKVNVYTIGYEGKSVDSFYKIILKSGIKRIIDVRNNPYSRKFGFSINTLSKVSRKLGIEYFNVQQLGITAERRIALENEDDYINLLQNYENNTLKDNENAVRFVAKLMKEKPSILICFESDHRFCHRSKVANKVADLIEKEIVNL